MRPSKEIVTANGTEKGGMGWIASAGMEKHRWLLRCLCKIIGSDLRRSIAVAQLGRSVDSVMQRYHVQVLRRVFCPYKDIVAAALTSGMLQKEHLCSNRQQQRCCRHNTLIILIRTIVTKTTVHIQLVVVKTFCV